MLGWSCMHETRGERGRDVHDDVVDWDVNELHKEPNEPHDSKPNCGRYGNTLELCGKSRQMVDVVNLCNVTSLSIHPSVWFLDSITRYYCGPRPWLVSQWRREGRETLDQARPNASTKTLQKERRGRLEDRK